MSTSDANHPHGPGPEATGLDTISPHRARQATAVAREFDALMGLSSIAMGIGAIVAGVTGQTAIYLAMGSLLSGASASWYVKRYGRVRGTSARNALIFAGAMAVVVILLLGFVLDRWLQGPVLFTLVGLAISLGVGQFLMLRRTGLTVVHWIVYAALVVASFAPMVGGPRGGAGLDYILVAAGLALIVLGIVDHRRLVRILGPVEKTEA